MHDTVTVDQLRSNTMFGVEAIYRVADVGSDHAVVEVVDVQGLAPGFRFRVTLEAVQEMTVVDRRAEVEAGLLGLLAA